MTSWSYACYGMSVTGVSHQHLSYLCDAVVYTSLRSVRRWLKRLLSIKL